MSDSPNLHQSEVVIRRHHHLSHIVLNRPKALNSLSQDMIRRIQTAMDRSAAEPDSRLVLFSAAGDRAFCAGSDIKALVRAVSENAIDQALAFFKDEFDLCLKIHCHSKPVIAFADGVTMGAGLGLAAGADIIIATERTRMAMPETRIGLFPDVGATGWLFSKSGNGYPEFVGLTGYEMLGAECVRLGVADCIVSSEKLPAVLDTIEKTTRELPPDKPDAVRRLQAAIEPFVSTDIPQNPDMDDWVRDYFPGSASVPRLLEDLSQCSIQSRLCEGVFHRLSERSPTALVLTLKLLRHNEGRPLEYVFQNDLIAARYMLEHPDFSEGVRARLIDKDDLPRWQPDTIQNVGSIDLHLN